MATFFTSDTHFDHRNIITYASRPFASVDDMNDTMVRQWNEVVKPGDTVWHLGDFTLGNPDVASRFLSRLTGHIHLVWGNHDRPQVRRMPAWASSQPYVEISVDGTSLVLFHYAMRVWNKCHYGALHLYGHSHNTLPGDSGSCDVGVDAWDFRPVSLPEIKQRLAQSPPRRQVDHHG